MKNQGVILIFLFLISLAIIPLINAQGTCACDCYWGDPACIVNTNNCENCYQPSTEPIFDLDEYGFREILGCDCDCVYDFLNSGCAAAYDDCSPACSPTCDTAEKTLTYQDCDDYPYCSTQSETCTSAKECHTSNFCENSLKCTYYTGQIGSPGSMVWRIIGGTGWQLEESMNKNDRGNCYDGHDNDCDGLKDCDDPSCKTGDETICYDEIDNNCNGCVDNDDYQCGGATEIKPYGGSTDISKCYDGIDNNCNGFCDYEGCCSNSSIHAWCLNNYNIFGGTIESCCTDFGLWWIPGDVVCPCNSTEIPETTCDDGYDNDCDGRVDCFSGNEDGDCGCVACSEYPTEVTCTGGLDEDCDGLIDIKDPDCNGCIITENPESSCDDGQDNDCDGNTDCLDSPDCDDYCLNTGDCILTNAYWNSSRLENNIQDFLVVNGTSDCWGLNIIFQITERDQILGSWEIDEEDSSKITINQTTQLFTNGATGIKYNWVTQWILDAGGEDNDSEYIFKAFVESAPTISKLSGILYVNQPGITNDCTDYSGNQANCESDPNEVGFYSENRIKYYEDWGMSCWRTEIEDGCWYNITDTKCHDNLTYIYDPANPLGCKPLDPSCQIGSDKQGNCGTGEQSFNITYQVTEGEGPNCQAYPTKTFTCPGQIKLDFFGFWNFLIAFVIVITISIWYSRRN